MPANLVFVYMFTFVCISNAFALNIKADYVWSTSNKKIVPLRDEKLTIFCYEPQRQTRTLFRTWTSVKFFVEETRDFTIYAGDNESHVYNQCEQASKSWFQAFSYWTQKVVYLSPFNKSCVGVISASQFVATLVVEAFNWCMFSCFMIGALLFFLAPKLSRNFVFHYGSGVIFGIMASLLIVAFVFGRFIPRKSLFYSMLFAGLSMSAYIWNYLYENLVHLLELYHWYLAGYVAITGLVSFAICYVKGPVTNPRLLTIIQWTIQAVAVFLMYISSQIKEVTIIFVILLLLIVRFEDKIKSSKNIWYYMFPPRPKLLTEEEYIQQGLLETEKALEELRQYCKSPNCNAWTMLSRLNSPVRFAKWVDGNLDHVTPSEANEHETSFDEYYSYHKDEEEDDY